MLSLWKSTELLAVIYIKAFPDIAATVKTGPFCFTILPVAGALTLEGRVGTSLKEKEGLWA